MAILGFGADETAQAGGAASSIHGADMDSALVQVYSSASSDPTVNNDGVDTAGLGEKFFVGSIWIRLDNNDRWQCDDITTGAAVWSQLATKQYVDDTAAAYAIALGA